MRISIIYFFIYTSVQGQITRWYYHMRNLMTTYASIFKILKVPNVLGLLRRTCIARFYVSMPQHLHLQVYTSTRFSLSLYIYIHTRACAPCSCKEELTIPILLISVFRNVIWACDDWWFWVLAVSLFISFRPFSPALELLEVREGGDCRFKNLKGFKFKRSSPRAVLRKKGYWKGLDWRQA